MRKLTIIDPLSLQVIYVKWNKKCTAVVQNKKKIKQRNMYNNGKANNSKRNFYKRVHLVTVGVAHTKIVEMEDNQKKIN